MYSRVPCFGAYGHRGRGEVLYLFQLEVESARDGGQFLHVLFPASWVAADEVWDELLAKSCTAVYVVEPSVEVIEQLERRLAHEVQHAVAGVFGCYLQSSAHVVYDEFFGIFASELLVGKYEVVTNSAANEALLYSCHLTCFLIDADEFLVVVVQVLAYLWMNTRRAAALLADGLVLATHAVHVCRRTSEVGDVTLEVGHVGYAFYLAQYAFLAATNDELALVCRDGAEGAAAKAASVQVDGVSNHFIGWDDTALGIFWMGQTRVRQIEGGIDLCFGEGE